MPLTKEALKLRAQARKKEREELFRRFPQAPLGSRGELWLSPGDDCILRISCTNERADIDITENLEELREFIHALIRRYNEAVKTINAIPQEDLLALTPVKE